MREVEREKVVGEGLGSLHSIPSCSSVAVASTRISGSTPPPSFSRNCAKPDSTGSAHPDLLNTRVGLRQSDVDGAGTRRKEGAFHLHPARSSRAVFAAESHYTIPNLAIRDPPSTSSGTAEEVVGDLARMCSPQPAPSVHDGQRWGALRDGEQQGGSGQMESREVSEGDASCDIPGSSPRTVERALAGIQLAPALHPPEIKIAQPDRLPRGWGQGREAEREAGAVLPCFACDVRRWGWVYPEGEREARPLPFCSPFLSCARAWRSRDNWTCGRTAPHRLHTRLLLLLLLKRDHVERGVWGNGKKLFTEDGGDEGVLHRTTNSSGGVELGRRLDSEGASHGRAGEQIPADVDGERELLDLLAARSPAGGFRTLERRRTPMRGPPTEKEEGDTDAWRLQRGESSRGV
ncbi:hypothetical protein DFH08DRAFT_1030491 [Mycena albidolilacea]|uniref:Uncharacterized protein n=1 Tax=Mycena albidolilacea TaxID=1033008 RepID=A0AAD6ZH24_9AGAR|nr:hypothetical protein DFH08DRAFT_1030491 [Mycena albidolilacea]